jgi:hypothetical protein
MSRTKKYLRNTVAATLAGVVLATGLPAGAAHAVQRVACTSPDNVGFGGRNAGGTWVTYCFRDAGGFTFTSPYYVVSISSGIYDIDVYYADGSQRFVPRRSIAGADNKKLYAVRIR